MPAWLKSFGWPILLVVFAVSVYTVRIHREMVDFEVYRAAASRALDGENLYRPSDGHYQFKYLPAFAFAMAPATWIEFRYARLIWYAVSFGLLCVFVRWSAESLPEKRLTEHALMWFAILFVGKYYARELNLGQTNILLGATLMAALLSAEAGARWTAGALVALGVFVKPYALILVPWLWFVAGPAALAAFALVLTAGLLLPALVFGWQGNIDQVLGWYRTVTDTSMPNILVAENVSIASTWAKWIGKGSVATVYATATSAMVLALSALIVTRRRGVREPAYLEFGMFMLLVPLLSPQGWDYVLLLATPAILILIDRWRDMSALWRLLTAIGLVGFSFMIFDVVGRPIYTFIMTNNVITVCSLVLAASLAHLRLRRLA
jgi:hypothetical protein